MWSAGTAKSAIRQVLYLSLFFFFFFFFWLSQSLIVWLGLGDLFISQNSCELYASHSPRTDSGLCIYHLFAWSNGSLSEKYLRERYESPYPVSYGLNSTTTVLLGEWLWHQITYKGWYAIKQRNRNRTLSFLAMSKFSRVRFCLFVAWNVHAIVFLPIFVF